MTIYSVLGATAFVLITVWILTLVREDRIMLKFGLPWLFVSVTGIAFAISLEFRFWATALFGFEQPANFFFSLTIGALAFLGILLSVEITVATKRLERAASAIAIASIRSDKTRNTDLDG